MICAAMLPLNFVGESKTPISLAYSANAAEFSAPSQNATQFAGEKIDTADISSWTSSKSTTALTTAFTDYTAFESFNAANLLSLPNDFIGHNGAVILTAKKNTEAYAKYTSDAYTLESNSYYKLSFNYYSVQGSNYFYVNGREFPLSNLGGWRSYELTIKTDILESSSITVELCLGRGTNSPIINGAVYYDDFNLYAIQSRSTADIDFTSNEISAPESIILDYATNNNAVPSILNFKERNYFYTQNGGTSNVLLLKTADNYQGYDFSSNLKLNYNDIYLISFYSITPNDFYLKFGDTYTTIETDPADKRHNGWQLNTFIVYGNTLTNPKDGYKVGFYVGRDDMPVSSPSWVAISDFAAQKITNDYANASAATVLVSSNNEFADITSTSLLNYAVNQAYHEEESAPVPTVTIKNYSLNNNVFMLQDGTITAAGYTTATNSDNFLSFDYFAVKKLTATIKSGEIEIKTLELSSTNGQWFKFEINLNENATASSKSITITFKASDTPAFFDNFKFAAKSLTQNYDTIQLGSITERFSFDTPNLIVNPANIYIYNTPNVTSSTIKKNFPDTISAEHWYKYSIKAFGSNATLSVSGYNEQLLISQSPSSTASEYVFYLYASADGSLQLLINLGVIFDADGNEITIHEPVESDITIESISLTSITETQFEEARLQDNAKAVILSVKTDSETDDPAGNTADENDFFGKNWWYLIPSLLTSISIILTLVLYLVRKSKFNAHITRADTSFIKDKEIEKNQKALLKAKKKKPAKDSAE
jgi:hypothetical protein